MIQIKKLTNYEKYIRDTSSVYFVCVLEGTVAGKIWVDDVGKPTFLLVYSNYQGGFQLMAQPAPVENE